MSFSPGCLKNCGPFIQSMEEIFHTSTMKPNDVTVDLASGGKATVSIFNVEAMILSLLHNETLLKQENIARDYNIFTGKPTKQTIHYGEIHTGDEWEPARY